jgi:hypothetical protein
MNHFYCNNAAYPVNTDQQMLSLIANDKTQTTNSISTASLDSGQGFVFVIGYIKAYFSSLSTQKELYQSAQLPDSQPSDVPMINDEISLAQLNQSPTLESSLYAMLSQPQNLYLAADLRWTLNNNDDNELYTLIPTSNDRLKQFVSALAPVTTDVQAPSNMSQCPVILVGQKTDDNIIAVSNIIPAIPQLNSQTKALVNNHNKHLNQLILNILSLNDNCGDNDNDRGLNYALYNNPLIYAKSYDLAYVTGGKGPNPNGYQLVDVKVKTQLSGRRLKTLVIFDYQGIDTMAIQSWYCSVDVSGEYPFMLSTWQRYLPRLR